MTEEMDRARQRVQELRRLIEQQAVQNDATQGPSEQEIARERVAALRAEAEGGLLGRIGNAITGRGRVDPNIPEITYTFPSVADSGEVTPRGLLTDLGTSLAYLHAPTTDDMGEIIKSRYPNAVMSEDRFGNPTAQLGGNSYYLNKPGLSFQDTIRPVAWALEGLGVGRAVGSLTPSLGNTARIGGAEALLSLASDRVAETGGADVDDSGSRAATAATLGVAGEAASPILRYLVRRLGRGTQLVRNVNGRQQLTPQAAQALQEAGIDPNRVSDDWLQRFAVEARSMDDPAAAARRTDLSTLDPPVPETRATITRNPSDWMFESEAAKGNYGSVAQDRATRAQASQAEALSQNLDRVQGQISGGQQQVGQIGQGGEIASRSLNEMADAQRQTVRNAYDQAESTFGGINAADAQELVPAVTANTSSRILANADVARQYVDDLQGIISQAGDGSVPVSTLFDWRRDLTRQIADAGGDTTNASALRDLKRGFDEWMNGVVDRNLLQGNQDAVAAWREAIGSRREFGKIFEANDLVERLTEQTTRSGARTLAVPPEQAANYIFGVANLKLGNMNLARDLGRIRDVLREGGQEQAWNALREEAFMRLLRQSMGPYQDQVTSRAFSGAKFATQIDNLLNRNRQLAEVLFTSGELDELERIKRAALATTTPPPGGVNTSNTNSALAQLVMNFSGRFSRMGVPLLNTIGDISGGIGASSAMPASGRATIPIGVGPRPGTLGGLLSGAREEARPLYEGLLGGGDDRQGLLSAQ